MSDLSATADLLNQVFGFDPPVDTAHLHWYYRQNPEGIASVGKVLDGERQLGNYTLVPTRFKSQSGPDLRLGLGVDLATHPAARGTGAFRRTVEDSYLAGAVDGLAGILGVANTQSAPRMAETMGWRLLPHLPARFLWHMGRACDTSHYLVTNQFLDGPLLDRFLPAPTPAPSSGYGTSWTADLLRWRLARPNARYTVHVTTCSLFVSTTIRQFGTRVAVLLKLLPLPPLSNSEPKQDSCPSIAAALARHHRTPFVLYWGINPLLRSDGLCLPRRLMPSPLDIVIHALDNEGEPCFDEDAFSISNFEFLDFDAY